MGGCRSPSQFAVLHRFASFKPCTERFELPVVGNTHLTEEAFQYPFMPTMILPCDVPISRRSSYRSSAEALLGLNTGMVSWVQCSLTSGTSPFSPGLAIRYAVALPVRGTLPPCRRRPPVGTLYLLSVGYDFHVVPLLFISYAVIPGAMRMRRALGVWSNIAVRTSIGGTFAVNRYEICPLKSFSSRYFTSKATPVRAAKRSTYPSDNTAEVAPYRRLDNTHCRTAPHHITFSPHIPPAPLPNPNSVAIRG